MPRPRPLQLFVTTGSDLPIYRQIMRQIADALAGGRLRPGDKLISQRELARELVISPLTVKKAYDELEREGLITTERGRGTFVSPEAEASTKAAQRDRLQEMARRLINRARLVGVDLGELVAMLREIDHQIQRENLTENPPTEEGES